MAETRSSKAALGWLLGWVISIAIFSALAGTGLILAYQAGDALLSWQRVQSWQAVTARLEKLELRRIPKQPVGSYAVEVAARYSYQFGGRTYTAERVGGFEGSREVDAWHETTYARLLQVYRQTRRGKNAEVTAWVDPARPGNAVLDRTLRWVVPLVLFPVAALFFGAAALMGYGIRMHLRRNRGVPPSSVERQAGDPDWAEVPEWRNGVVRSDALGGVVLAWVFPVVAGLSAWGIAVSEYHHGRISLVGAAGLLGFGALAAWLAFVAVRKTLLLFRQGQMFLHTTPFPPRLGRELHGVVNLPRGAGSDEIKVSLACMRERYADDHAPTQVPLWEGTTRVHSQYGASGPMLDFKIMLPGHLPASAWRSRSNRAQEGVNWIVHIESPEAGIDRAFKIPVLADQGSSAAPSADAAPARGDIPDMMARLRSMRERKLGAENRSAGEPEMPAAKVDLALAAPYVRQSGGELNLDSRLQPNMARTRWGGLAFLLLAPACAIFPSLWYASARWHGSLFEIALTLGAGILVLIPAVMVPVLAWIGVQRLSRRIRAALSPERIVVSDRNWLWSKTARFDTSSVARISARSMGNETSDRGINRYYDIVAALDGGREVALAWGVRDTDVAQALAATLQNACGGSRRIPMAKAPARVELRRRPAAALVLVCLLIAIAPAAFERLLQLAPGEDYANDVTRMEQLAALSADPGYLHQWLSRDDAIHIPPRWLLRRWTTAARSRLAAGRAAPAGAEVRAVPLNAQTIVIDGVIGEGEWRGALVLALQPETLGSLLRLRSDGERLYLAADVPGDTTTEGFDQFRVSLHLGLAPGMSAERVLVGRNAGISVLRDFRVAKAGGGGTATRHFSDRITYQLAKAATAVDGHRRYELALDLGEAGIAAGAPFTMWAEIEGDPRRDPDGKFKSRTSLGRTAEFREPVWLQILGMDK